MEPADTPNWTEEQAAIFVKVTYPDTWIIVGLPRLPLFPD